MTSFKVRNKLTGEEIKLNKTQTIEPPKNYDEGIKRTGEFEASVKINKIPHFTFGKVNPFSLVYVALWFMFFIYIKRIHVSLLFNRLKIYALEEDNHASN